MHTEGMRLVPIETTPNIEKKSNSGRHNDGGGFNTRIQIIHDLDDDNGATFLEMQ